MASINDLATAASAVSALNPSTTPSQPPLWGTDEADAPSAVRGALVVLEGLDRSGKTTQVKLLEQRFVELGRKVKVMRFPGKVALSSKLQASFGLGTDQSGQEKTVRHQLGR
jgi:dTMP kinase